MLTYSMRRWLIGVTVLIALVMATAPIAAVQAIATSAPTPQQTDPEIPGWALRVTFPKDSAGQHAPRVVYTVYTFVAGPPMQVVDSIQEDISDNCTTHGVLQYDGDYAIFDGVSTYLECDVPAWRDLLSQINPSLPAANPNQDTITCDAYSAASAAADVNLATGTHNNPLIDASKLGIAFGLPRNSGQAQTRLGLHPNTYTSPPWNVANTGNRMVIGINGPVIVTLDNHFGWKPYLDPAWKPWFENNITGAEIGHISYPSSATWQNPAVAYQLRTSGGTVYIGRNVAGSQYFKGRLADAIVDPPCKSGG